MPARTAEPLAATLHDQLPLIEVAEAWMLDSLLADPTLQRYILTRLSECMAIVVPGQAESLQARLRKSGYVPKVLVE